VPGVQPPGDTGNQARPGSGGRGAAPPPESQARWDGRRVRPRASIALDRDHHSTPARCRTSTVPGTTSPGPRWRRGAQSEAMLHAAPGALSGLVVARLSGQCHL
jgi:hypothetical protein